MEPRGKISSSRALFDSVSSRVRNRLGSPIPATGSCRRASLERVADSDMRRQPLIDACVVATLLLLSATGACTFVQNSQEPAFPAQARVASDADLAARVKAALHADTYVNDTHIDVLIENGNVVLTGLVEDNRALLDALQIAKEAADGRKVIDALSIMKTSAR